MICQTTVDHPKTKMEDTKKRQRSKNFTPTEVAVLAEEMKIHGAQVAAKHSSGGPDAVTKKTQDRLWSKITASVNSAGVCCRSVGEVREKWRNLQRKAKAEFTAERISVLKTGGGPPLQSQSCGVTRDLIDLMKDRSSFSGIPGAQDCETVIFSFGKYRACTFSDIFPVHFQHVATLCYLNVSFYTKHWSKSTTLYTSWFKYTSS